MQIQRILVALFLFLAIPLVQAEKPSTDESKPADQEESHGAHAHDDHADHGAGLTPHAPVIFKLGPIQITNSMFVTIIVGLGIILVAQLATRNVKLIPSGLQNFVAGDSYRDFFARGIS